MFKGFILTFVLVICVAGAIGISYIFLNTSSIPYQKVSCDATLLTPEEDLSPVVAKCVKATGYLEMKVTLPIYSIGALSFLGWFFLAIYGGIGLISLPVDFILEYKDRPRKLTKPDLEKITPKLLTTSQELIRSGEELKRRYTNEVKKKKRSFATMGEIDQYEEAVNALEYVINSSFSISKIGHRQS